MRPIFLDHHSTTPVDPRVVEAMLPSFTEHFGNPHSYDHVYGDHASDLVIKSSRTLAALVGAGERDITYVSGATEGVNLVLRSVARKRRGGRARIAVSPVEHKAVLDTCQDLSRQGYLEVIFTGIDSNAQVDLCDVERIVKGRPDLLCIMAANNEVGTIYPIEQIATLARANGVPYFCDASQAPASMQLNCLEWGVTYLVVSAHKMYGPKGIGALVAGRDAYLEPQITGGGQQRGVRAGTLNVPGIVGMGAAAQIILNQQAKEVAYIAGLRDKLQALLLSKIGDLKINGDLRNRLPGSLHLSAPHVRNDVVIARLRHLVAISTGSACTSGIEQPSHVLSAMSMPIEFQQGALRISLGRFNYDDEIDCAAEILASALSKVRSFGLN